MLMTRKSLIKRARSGAGILASSTAALFLCVGAGLAGPCTTQIAELEQKVSHLVPGPESGPTAPQSVGAQLHHQPTPGSVGSAEGKARADAAAALERARKADADGNAPLCARALQEARDLYEIP
jgi:hypothetical protein